MPKLSKTELRDQQVRLGQLEKYLPTLQLKKAMLQAQSMEVRAEIVILESDFHAKESLVAQAAPLLQTELGFPSEKMAEVTVLTKTYENVAGVEIPKLEALEFAPLEYSLLVTEPFVDGLVVIVRECKRAEILVQVAQEKRDVIEKELREVSIRVNLFEKILIPRTKELIRQIKTFLSDQQLAAVARAKVAKKKIEERKLAH